VRRRNPIPHHMVFSLDRGRLDVPVDTAVEPDAVHRPKWTNDAQRCSVAQTSESMRACGREGDIGAGGYGSLQWYSLRQANTTASRCLAETTCKACGERHRT